ncbi:MAG TPA: class I SAM-dependent methyltransferase [Casimicrobiaceae bacterium]|jgi:cyclopropane fatty-acyl-phospholipid synthase-like methyltransferase
MADPGRFANLTFEDFRRLAQDSTLTKFERIGFPDSYRAGHEQAIFADIRRKLTNLDLRDGKVLDIGPGCSDLPSMLIDHCVAHDAELHLIDSPEMLSHLPEREGVHRLAARYPDCADFLAAHQGRFDAILCYSVLHYVFVDVPLYRFLDSTLALLAPGGQFLIGDIPNVSKRKRFFASDTGAAFHRAFMHTDEAPHVEFNRIEPDQIDDAVVMSLTQRARSAGFDAYVVPQDAALPMANRREDILIVRP